MESMARRLHDEEVRKKREEEMRKKASEVVLKRKSEVVAKAKWEQDVKAREEDYRKFIMRSIWKALAPLFQRPQAYTHMTVAYELGKAIVANRPICTGINLQYSISPDLPAGLQLMNNMNGHAQENNGVVSGVPTEISSPVPYTVTCANNHGKDEAELTLSVWVSTTPRPAATDTTSAAPCPHGGETNDAPPALNMAHLGPWPKVVTCLGKLDAVVAGRVACELVAKEVGCRSIGLASETTCHRAAALAANLNVRCEQGSTPHHDTAAAATTVATAAKAASTTADTITFHKILPGCLKLATLVAARAICASAKIDTKKDACMVVHVAVARPAMIRAVADTMRAAQAPTLDSAAQLGATMAANKTSSVGAALTDSAHACEAPSLCSSRTDAAVRAWLTLAAPKVAAMVEKPLRDCLCALRTAWAAAGGAKKDGGASTTGGFADAVALCQYAQTAFGTGGLMRASKPAASGFTAEQIASMKASVTAEAGAIMKMIKGAADKAAAMGETPDMNLVDFLDPECQKRRPMYECVAEAVAKAKVKKPNTTETPLACTGSTLENSDQLLTSCDMRDNVQACDRVRVGTLDQDGGGQVFEVCPPLSAFNLKLNSTFKGGSNTGLLVTVLPGRGPGDAPCGCPKPAAVKSGGASLPEGEPLSCCVDVLHGSVLMRTRCDLRAELAEGEVVKISCKPVGGVLQPPFAASVTSPRDKATMTLTESYPGETSECCKVEKTKAPTNPGECTPLSGTVSTLRG
jgi:hypothetical protein